VPKGLYLYTKIYDVTSKKYKFSNFSIPKLHHNLSSLFIFVSVSIHRHPLCSITGQTAVPRDDKIMLLRRRETKLQRHHQPFTYGRRHLLFF